VDFRRRNDQPRKLSGGDSSCAFEINSSGVIAGDSFVSSTVVDAASWTDNKIKSLGALPKGIFTAALDLNDDGEIVGESVFGYGPPFTSHGFEWTSAGGMKDLGTLSGGDTSIANAVNSSGIIAGQSNSGSVLYWHAVKWNSSDTIDDLGTLPAALQHRLRHQRRQRDCRLRKHLDNAAHAML